MNPFVVDVLENAKTGLGKLVKQTRSSGQDRTGQVKSYMGGFFGGRSWFEDVNKVIVGRCYLSRIDRALDTPEHGIGQLGAENDLNSLKVGRKNDQTATGSIGLSKNAN